MLKNPKFVLETAMHAPVLISLQLTNIFHKDLHKVNITTLVFVKGFTERPDWKVLLRDTDFERKYCQMQ